MPQFFVHTAIEGAQCVITGDDYHHLARVRRVKPGDDILIRDVTGNCYRCMVNAVSALTIVMDIIEPVVSGEWSFDLTLCAAVLKGKNFDFLIQKAVEVGVSHIKPVLTERTVPSIDEKKERKSERWSRIALEASKQSMRNRPPIVSDAVEFSKLVSAPPEGTRLIAHTDETFPGFREFFRSTPNRGSVALLVGPEGGFSRKEVIEACDNGWVPLHFGFTSLRSETAAIVFSALILYEWGDYYENHGERPEH